jgi:histidine phosphotransferase ChpT
MKPQTKPNPEFDTMTIDVRLLEMMASKICHDLISPVGAVANGVEILEDMGSDPDGDVVNLIAFSSSQATAKLKALRLAYGQGGADTAIKPEDVLRTFSEFIAGDGRIVFSGDMKSLGPTSPVHGYPKTLMCALLLLIEALPKGGSISASMDGAITKITGEGENAGLREGYPEALEQKTPSENLNTKHIHAALTGMIAAHYGFTIAVESGSGTISLILTPPAA